ncbi:MAG: nucleotidyltransferase [Verrucomicrobia bacterium]|nr:nucleotidyltransferase [Verrucomicrobiota bacterium]
MRSQRRSEVCQAVMQLLCDNKIDFLVGGAYALAEYTRINRDTKDFDLFLRPEDVEPALTMWRKAGFAADYTFTHWLAKVQCGRVYIDIIFRSGNGLGSVDDVWFEHARQATIFSMEVKIVPPEELIWQKAYIMERERFDGADVTHMLSACAPNLDWDRLVNRFDLDWRVLWSHLILFGFIFPSKRHLIPSALMKEFAARGLREQTETAMVDPVCNGTLLSRIQYQSDLPDFLDGRLTGRSAMTADELQRWVEAGSELARRHKP